MSSRLKQNNIFGLFVFFILVTVKEVKALGLEILPVEKYQKIPEGKSAFLSCMANADNPDLVTTLEWKDPRGFVINEAEPGEKLEIYSEKNKAKQTSLLYITSMTRAMAGTYTCVGSIANVQHELSVTIDTYVAITWKNAAEDQYATKGKDYKVMCEVYAEPPPTIDWFKDGSQNFSSCHRYVILPDGLLIKDVQESDDGVYTCRVGVYSTGELKTRHIKLEVQTPPEMLEREPVVEVREGETTSIKCQATGKPPPEYTWIRESTRENLAIASRFKVMKLTGQLIFDKVEAGDYGTYICRAINNAGQNETKVTVNVIVPPKIFELYNITAAEKTNTQIICKAFGRPAPQVAFRKRSRFEPFTLGAQTFDDRITVETNVSDVGDHQQTMAVLSISHLNKTDDGLYECIASNKGGEARKNGHIAVQFKPSFAAMPKVPIWSWNSRPVNLSCVAESIPNATIKWRYRGLELHDTPQIRIYGSGPASYITVIPTDKSLYDFYTCIATNPLGEDEYTIDFREGLPPGPIAQVTQTIVTATSVQFTIVGPAENLNPPTRAYVVQYKDNNNFDFGLSMNRTWSVTSLFVVEGLKPMTLYDFRFAAINDVGQGPWGAQISVPTQRRSVPEVPKWRDIVTPGSIIRSSFADRYELRWKIPVDNGEPILSYKLEYCVAEKVNGEWRIPHQSGCQNIELKSVQTISYEIRPLRPDTKYRVRLMATNILGDSLPTEVYIQTAPGDSNDFFNNEIPVKAGFYDVYTGANPLDPSAADLPIASSVILVSSLLILHAVVKM